MVTVPRGIGRAVRGDGGAHGPTGARALRGSGHPTGKWGRLVTVVVLGLELPDASNAAGKAHGRGSLSAVPTFGGRALAHPDGVAA